MKKLLLPSLLLLLLASCVAPKKVPYFQDLEAGDAVKIIEAQEIRLKPGDKFTVHINSKDEELVRPFNLIRSSGNSGGGSETRLAHTVDSEGFIDFPTIGKIHVEGMTRDKLAKHIKKLLLENKLVGDPVVIVQFTDMQVSIIGEVGSPGKVNINKDRYTILDAITDAGDLTIQGQRDNITVLREEYGVQRAYSLNLNDAAQLHSSPAFYLQQNDIVYVEPNGSRAAAASTNGNSLRNASFWMSLASFALTIVTFFTK
ncbi:MAG: polysaccharide biosynthesis/export family protein [Bacteroidales bacterium]|nr:polysaccharide biosynthesis/export family protein [Bacteroidales bacterium]